MPAQVIDLTNLAPSEGFIIQGDEAGDLTGNSVANVGDINGDGVDDLIVGAYGGDDGGSAAGEAYVIFGRATGFGALVGGRRMIDLTTLSTSDGFIIQGDLSGDAAGQSVSNAGDINGDGIDDLIIGAPRGDDGGSNAGEAYIIFGRTTGFGTTVGARRVIDLTNLSASDGFIVQGDTAGDRAGYSVSNAGDVNGDGIDDLIIGAGFGSDGGTRAGEAYVIFGRTTGFGVNVGGRQVVDLTSLSASDGFIIQGDSAYDFAGGSVSSAGDVNGDGIDDLIVGARGGDDGGADSGEAYVIFGRATGFGTNVSGRQVIDLTSLSASDGFVIQGDTAGDDTGRSVSGAGDVNGDGIDDLIIGAPYGDDGGSAAGEAYVIFGRTTGFGTAVGGRRVIDLTSLSASDGFIIRGDADLDVAGFSVSNAGDINGDGVDDIVIGARGGDDGGSAAGEAYVIFGRTSGFGTDIGGRRVIDLTSLSVSDALIIQGDQTLDAAGVSVSAAGDVNGDGIDDLIVGAQNGGDGGAYAGEAYVIFGSRNFGATNGTAAGDTLTGTAGADTINGLGGNDVLDGGAGADTMRGGADNDIYVVDDAGDVVEELASEGTDRVETNLAAYTLTANVENLEYTGTGDFTGTGNGQANHIVGAAGNDTLSGGDGDDTLGGEDGDDILNGGDGNDRLIGGIDGIGVDTLNGGAGNDFLVVDNFFGDVANGGDGYDTLQIDASISGFFGSPIAPYVIAADIEAVQVLSAPAVSVRLNALDNLMGGSIGDDYVFAGAGNDSVYGRGGSDYLVGEDGNDKLFGEAGQDQLYGDNGTDLLYGGADNDYIEAGAGNDTLYGEGGDDTLFGGAGVDQLFGGAGADLFRFVSGDSGTITATADRIRDFAQAQGDRIDLSAIDAIAGGADNGFSFIGSAAFSNVAGQLRAVVSGGQTLVSGDTNGDGVADFLIRIDGVHTLGAGDFIL